MDCIVPSTPSGPSLSANHVTGRRFQLLGRQTDHGKVTTYDDKEKRVLNTYERESVWPDDLAPIGEGIDKESFDEWWQRNSSKLPNIPPLLAEQWPFRHWDYSPYNFIDLSKITCSEAIWPTEKILREVYVRGRHLDDPDADYEIMNTFRNPTATPMNETGTWDYPIVVVKTPTGIINEAEEIQYVKYMLIEGHQRRRYLNALNARGAVKAEHRIFVLDYSGA
jgi:hypothetical protein